MLGPIAVAMGRGEEMMSYVVFGGNRQWKGAGCVGRSLLEFTMSMKRFVQRLGNNTVIWSGDFESLCSSLIIAMIVARPSRCDSSAKVSLKSKINAPLNTTLSVRCFKQTERFGRLNVHTSTHASSYKRRQNLFRAERPWLCSLPL
jgi:hypothetical protein